MVALNWSWNSENGIACLEYLFKLIVYMYGNGADGADGATDRPDLPEAVPAAKSQWTDEVVRMAAIGPCRRIACILRL